MNSKIRLAQQSDYDAVVAIMDQVQQLHVELRPDIYRSTDELLPKEIFEKEIAQQTFYVAECEKRVVGVLQIIFRHVQSPAHVTRDVIFIDAMAVDAAYRGKGIGHQMFAFLKELRDAKGYDGIELQVNAKNRAAYEMYTKCGFTEKSINMELL